MAHTPLLQQLRRAFSTAADSASSGRDVNDIIAARHALSVSRRTFLRQAALGTAMLASGPLLSAKKPSKPQARVVVVGAGLAGLTCAYRLNQAGIDATIYEANTRLGGRCWTRRGDFLDGQIAEHGGELIDQGHTEIRQLAQELRLPLDNLLAAEPNGTEPVFFFDGAPYAYADATRDLKAIWQKIHRDLSEAGYPTLFNLSTPRGQQLDQMSILDWIDESVPGGRFSRLGQLLDVAYNIEYGAECEKQSALSLLYLLGYNSPGQFSLFGASNEKYHVRGGNDRIVSTLATVLGTQLITGTALLAAKQTPAGRYQLTLQGAGAPFEDVADHVVFALPFSILRTLDLNGANFSALKMTAINQLAMGSNSKLNVGFTRRHWVSLGNNGDTFSDQGYQATWEVSRGQPGKAGILVAYSGGNYADTFGVGTPAARADQFLAQIEPVLPGLSAYKSGHATIDYWRGDPYVRGSYAYWQVGQYTQFAGVEGLPEGQRPFLRRAHLHRLPRLPERRRRDRRTRRP
jgi:monoamine oxidase